MKRLFLEWGAIAATGLSMTLAAVWFASYFIDPWAYQLTLASASEFHVITHDGYISFFNDTDIDRQSGQKIILKIYDPNDPMEIIDTVTTHIAWPIPGFQLFYCRLGNGNTVWSLEISSLLLILLLLIVAMLMVRRIRRVATATANTPPSPIVAMDEMRTGRKACDFVRADDLSE